MEDQSAEKLYGRRVTERSTYLHEAWRSAQLTIPSLIPDENDILDRHEPADLAKPHQSLGARGVNNLASKMLLALLPSAYPFFKYFIAEKTKEEAEATSTDLAAYESLLARRESRVNAEVDLQGIRPKFFAAVRHLLVAGNALLYKVPGEGAQLFPLNAYTAKRDGKGKLLDLIYVEKMSRDSIDDQRVLDLLPPEDETDDTADGCIPLFTRVKIQRGGKYKSWQEVNKQAVPGTEETWDAKNLPWIILRYTAIDGEDYGRGFIEEYRGDLTAFEQLSRDVKFSSANAAKTVFGIRPGSQVKPKKFQDTANGGALVMEPEDVFAVQSQKSTDMNIAGVQMDRLERALSANFLLNSAFQRDAERVTAEEIRRIAEELEDTLGGVLSLLSQELQLPLATLLENDLIKTDPTFKRLPSNAVRVGVVTGIAAIGRNQALERFRNGLALTAEAAQIIPGITQYLDEATVIKMLWTGTGVETDGLLKSDDDVAEERAEQQKQMTAQTTGQELAKGAGQAVGTVGGTLEPEQLAEMVGGLSQ